MKKIVLTLRRNTWIKIILFLVIAFVVPNNVCIAGAKTMMKKRLVFAENKGQIIDQYGNHRTDIDYKTGSGSMSVFVGSGHLYYQFHRLLNDTNRAKQRTPSCRKDLEAMRRRLPDTTSPKYQMYRLDMTLVGANPHAVAMAEDKQAYYENYHTSMLTTDSCSPVCTYSKVTYKNIYPNIDWVLYIKDNQLEYDFIVNPGGNADYIKIRYDGADAIANSTDSININTPFGDIIEKQLYAYEQDSKKPIPICYTCRGNTFGYALTTNHSPFTIIIDPVLAWGTYFGDIGNEEVEGRNACDKNDNIILVGFTTSLSNIATTGTHQTEFMGIADVFVAKFDNMGNILWGTYYGGTSYDYALGVACDTDNNIFITGYTGSSSKIATPGSHKDTIVGGSIYVYLAKFNSNGIINWGTYYGSGNGNNFGRDITTDSKGNIILTGSLNSFSNSINDTGFATPGSYQDTFYAVVCSFLSKFSNDGKLLWGTFFGIGNSVDTGVEGSYAMACTTDRYDNIIITGGVTYNGIVTTPGCYQPTNNGEVECFLAKFDESGGLLWSTYYGGTGGEGGQSIICDSDSNIYITGFTLSTTGIATPGAYQTTYGGGQYDAFLASFDQFGAMRWATYYGGTGDDECYGVVYDNLGFIYIAGQTNSDSLIATPGSYQDSSAGQEDAFLAKFNTSGSLIWATYYGGPGNDYGWGLSANKRGSINMCGNTFSWSGIATPGTFLDAMPSDSCETFLIRFDTGINGINIIIPSATDVKIEPNPNKGKFMITCSGIQSNDNSVIAQVLNCNGNSVYSNSFPLQNGIIHTQITLPTDIVSGVYDLILITKTDKISTKFTIEK